MERREAVKAMGMIAAGFTLAPSLLRAAPAAAPVSTMQYRPWLWDEHPPFRITRRPASSFVYDNRTLDVKYQPSGTTDIVHITPNLALWPYTGNIEYTVVLAEGCKLTEYEDPGRVLGTFSLQGGDHSWFYVDRGVEVRIEVSLKLECQPEGSWTPTLFRVHVPADGQPLCWAQA